MSAVLGLGTVQFGADYGISNQRGMPGDAEVTEILQQAHSRGVRVLDTAALYGRSEEVLGQQDLSGFRVVTKTPRFASEEIVAEQAAELVTTFERSLSRLNLSSVYGLLSHHAEDLLAPGGELLWQAMAELKAKGLVEKIGASIYQGEQLDLLLACYPLDLVQLPFNVLDQRLAETKRLQHLQRAGVEVHARSAFLQGLLLMDDYPDYFLPVRERLLHWRRRYTEQGMTATQAALAFVRDQQGIDVVLVGVTNVDQMLACARDFSSGGAFDGSGLGLDDVAFIDPSKWEL